uniref:SBP-type domain-containing protein n=1 Tax=Tetradesmus obliquus TaxID=3088 RepID=A0A383VD00_TETOB|eukprot:jgi/Sobl393_1/13743/SZX63447.1
MAAGPTPPVHKSCSRGVTCRLCLVEGCTVDLSGPDVKPYCWKRQLCMEHMRAQAVRRKGCGNTLFRFCQQCGKLEQLARFQGQKRSCRTGLRRRRTNSSGDADKPPAHGPCKQQHKQQPLQKLAKGCKPAVAAWLKAAAAHTAHAAGSAGPLSSQPGAATAAVCAPGPTVLASTWCSGGGQFSQEQHQLLLLPASTGVTASAAGLPWTHHHHHSNSSTTTSSTSAGDAFPNIPSITCTAPQQQQQQHAAVPCVAPPCSAGPGLAAAAALMMPYAAALPALCDVACGPAACGSEAQLPQALNDWLDMEAERLVGEVMGTAAGAAVTVQQQAQHAQQQQQQQQQRLPLETCQAIAHSLMAMEQQLQQQQQHQHQQQPTLQLQACCSMPLAW